MGTKTVRLEEEVYERVKSHKRDDETFSEAIDRLIGGWSLLDLAGTMSEEEADRHRELLAEVDEDAKQDLDEMLEQMDVDLE